MSTSIADTLNAFAKLRHSQEIPDHLLKENPQRNGSEFDPNTYFDVLTRLRMADGFVLDYAYSYCSSGAEPRLYARRKDSTRVMTLKDANEWHTSSQLLNYLVADGSPESFIEFVAFHHMASQFYLYWHAGYKDDRVLTAPMVIDPAKPKESDIEPAELTQEDIDAFHSISAAPSVTLKGDIAIVDYCRFSNFRGLKRVRASYCRQPPHLLYDVEVIGEVDYRCSICF